MKALKKAVLLFVRTTAYRANALRLYYWSDNQLSGMWSVHVLPGWYYRCLYKCCMGLIRVKMCRRLANWGIHNIPLRLRFEIA